MAVTLGSVLPADLIRSLVLTFGVRIMILLCVLFCIIPQQVVKWAEDSENQDLRFAEVVNNSEYDFIIVGAGSAGSVVANRLIKSPSNYRVLVLEAGGEQPWITYIPALSVTGYESSDFRYKSLPQTRSCQACKNNQFNAVRGKVLGGSSVLNLMMYLRGNPKTFDEWAQYVNDPSWNSTYTTRLFKKHEHYTGLYPEGGTHGCGGELNVDRRRYLDAAVDNFVKAMKVEEQQNRRFMRDVNRNEDQTNSFMLLETTTSNGYRWSTNTAFLSGIRNTNERSKIQKFSFVTKLLFDDNNPDKVIGVEYVRHWKKEKKIYRAFAKKEVILSAGAIDSPKILMHSGIGPMADLKEYNIPVRKDLPVGKNLQDHVAVAYYIVMDSDNSFVLERDAVVDLLLPPLINDAKGWVSASSGLATGFFSTPLNKDPAFPDIQHYFTNYGVTRLVGQILSGLFPFNDEEYMELAKRYGGHDGHFAVTTLALPQSSGTVKLNKTVFANSNDYNRFMSDPVIDPNYFDHPEDEVKLIRGLQDGISFFQNNSVYQKLNARFASDGFKSCADIVDKKSDEFFKCWVRHFTCNLWHYCGTCKMGPSGDPTAVVDSRLRVHGLQGLRVIDASIMPWITNANINAPTIMIGEKGAEMILEDHGGIPYVGSAHECTGQEEPKPLPPNEFQPPNFQSVIGLVTDAVTKFFLSFGLAALDKFECIDVSNQTMLEQNVLPPHVKERCVWDGENF